MEEAITNAIATIHGLGLTMAQAKIYVTLVVNGVLNVANLSKLAKVHRTDIYRLVKELEKKGLVERILTHPTSFKAIPLGECIDTLLKRHNEKSCQLRNEALKLKREFGRKIKGEKVAHESKFVLIPAQRVTERIANSIERTQKSVDVILTSMRFMRGNFAFSDKIKESWSRGVKWRIAIHKKEESEAFWNQINFYGKQKHCQIKFITDEPLNVTGIYDQKEVFIIESPKMGLTESPALWSDNPALIHLASDHFEGAWKQGTKYP